MSSSALRFLSARLQARRHALGTRWRRLNAGRQTLPALPRLRNGHTCPPLAAGSGVGTATACRCVTEAVELPAALAPMLAEPVRAASMNAYPILDGTLLPVDRIAADRPLHSGKHRKHGMAVQIAADPKGRSPWASPALSGAVQDVRAAHERGVVGAPAEAGIDCWADKGHQGAGGTARTPFDRAGQALAPAPRDTPDAAFAHDALDPCAVNAVSEAERNVLAGR
ncbi:hypothetical protein GCM10010421_21900 [Streptomyces glaucus]|uniref:DDE Tnp4 domain-containing protein n=1 Tax=Streptomyces glaucus TaxID=284029 RepID=A0ABP5WPQ5_9ACTN